MSRQRLSWDEGKVAEIMKQADPYTMNQERSNPPAEKYTKGGPEEFGEGQDHTHRWEGEGRTEDGHPAPSGEQGAAAPAAVAPEAPTPEREAIVQAKRLEDKALKCITIAQRMLPGADESVIEDQATEFMFLPERAIMASLQRQTDLATKIAAEAEKEEVKPEAEAKEEAVKPETPAEEAEEKKAAEEVEKPEAEEKPAEEKAEEKPAEEAAPATKEASDKDLLDILFDSAEMIPEVKTGAKKLTGLVKKASSNDDPLASLWGSTPDISDVFK